MKTFLKYIFLAAAIAAFAGMANAIPTLTISSGGTTVMIVDNVSNDLSSLPGYLLWSGAIGNWKVTTEIATTYPLMGSAGNPYLDLTFNAVSSGVGLLTMDFSADGFTAGGNASAVIAGTMSGNVAYLGFASYQNTSTLLTTLPVFNDATLPPDGYSSSPFSGAITGNAVNNSEPYSLTEHILIYETGVGQITGDATLTVPDSGTTLMLLGAALTGLGLFSRSRKRLS
jgi:hypothetical protein